jgi:hypothetical protein
MATMIVKHRVKDFESWKRVFLEMTPIRKRFGWRGHTVLQDATDPNLVTIINRVGSLDQAKAYGASPELRAGMEKAGVAGPPEISFCDDTDEQSY